MKELMIRKQKKFMLASILFFVASSGFATYGESRTFFRPRSAVEDVSLYLGLNNYNIYNKFYAPSNYMNDKKSLFIDAGVFYEQSTNAKQLAKYFLPKNESCVSIKEDGSGDIGSLWFELIAPDDNLYSSKFKIRPERSIIGAYINYHQNFLRNKRLWLDVKWDVYEATHKLRAKEEVISGPGIVPGVDDALDYLSGHEFHYGKISNHKSKVFGIDDIEVKLGGEVYKGDKSQFSMYASGLIPTANQANPDGRKLFEAVVGRGHWGLGAGFNGGLNFLNSKKTSLTLMGDLSYQYLFEKKEKRSFDLKCNGDWSRYLKVIRNNMPPFDDMDRYMDRIETSPNTMNASGPAVNHLTKLAGVTPGSTVNLWTALHCQHSYWNIEFGYNFWWRQAEGVSVKKKCHDLGVGIFNLNNTPPESTYYYSCYIQEPGTASSADISQSRTLGSTDRTGPNDVVTDMDMIDNTCITIPEFIPLEYSDLKAKSASHPSCLTNKIYLAGSYDFKMCKVPFNVGLGGSFEFANENALQQFGVWGNIQLMF